MKQLIFIMITIVLLSGCIFTPPESEVVTPKEIETSHEKNSSKKVWGDVAAMETNPLLKTAKELLGTPYVFGGMSPEGFDCSGFVAYVYARGVGKMLPRTAFAQSTTGEIIDWADLIPGDILCFDTSDEGNVNHTGIYLGKGDFIHASSGNIYSVTISNMQSGFYQKAFRWGVRVSYSQP